MYMIINLSLLLLLFVERNVVRDGRPEVCELIDSLQGVLADVDGRRGGCVLPHDVGLFQTDGETEVLACS